MIFLIQWRGRHSAPRSITREYSIENTRYTENYLICGACSRCVVHSMKFTPKKIGIVFINRFAIDEDASPEILKIVELEDEHFFLNRPDKGTDHFIVSANIAKNVIKDPPVLTHRFWCMDPCMKNYFMHHVIGQNPDVDVEEMNKSDSKSKYVHVRCTIPLNIETTDFWNTKRNKNNGIYIIMVVQDITYEIWLNIIYKLYII